MYEYQVKTLRYISRSNVHVVTDKSFIVKSLIAPHITPSLQQQMLYAPVAKADELHYYRQLV